MYMRRGAERHDAVKYGSVLGDVATVEPALMGGA
jgi:hypothetical protein